ncbi:hypothetical protein EDC96DRAFT_581508 [Choanephora cucurbitarum]|nr:hypothetical protein EDC96DRAFT_581508 [Choanephora cucurbitarum]
MFLDAFSLPLGAIVNADCAYSLPRPLLQTTVADFHEYRPNGHLLAPKQSLFTQCLRLSSLCLYNPAHAASILKTSNFFAFRRRLLLSGDDPALYNPCTLCKTFRTQITQSSTALRVHHQTLSKTAWSRFWRLAITTVQRNVLYRLLHRLIPT